MVKHNLVASLVLLAIISLGALPCSNVQGIEPNHSATTTGLVAASELWNFTAINHTIYRPSVSWLPKIVGDKVYAVASERYQIPGEHHPLLPYGRRIETLYTLNNNGTQLWNFTVNFIYRLKVVDKTVYFTARISDFHNFDRLYALDADSGAQKWMFYGSGNIEWYTLADNIMYVAVAHTPIGSNFYLCALNTTTGHQIWKQTFAWGDDGPTSFIVDRGLIYFSHAFIGVDGEDEYYAINGTDGTTFWKTHLSEGNFGPSALIDGLICYSTRDAVYAMNATDGAIVWNVPKERGYFFYPTFSYNGDIIYALGHKEHERPIDKAYPKIYALNACDGSNLWNYSVGENYLTGLGGDIYNSLDIIDETLYLLVDYSSLSAVNGITGQQVWNHSGRPYPIDNGIVYFHEDNYTQKQTTLEAIDSSNGNSLWNYSSTLNYINAQNNIIFFQQSSTLYALKIEATGISNANRTSSDVVIGVSVVLIVVLLIVTIAFVLRRNINRRL